MTPWRKGLNKNVLDSHPSYGCQAVGGGLAHTQPNDVAGSADIAWEKIIEFHQMPEHHCATLAT